MSKRNECTRLQTAILLNVTPARVSQIAKEMGIAMHGNTRDGFAYARTDVAKMLKRNKTPGPKRNGEKR